MTLVVLICALGVAILTALASAVAVWRVRNSADQRVADAVQKLAAGMQETMRDLAQAVETAQISRADLHVGELAASLDLDEVTERTLEAASEIVGVEGALLDAEAPEGARLSATVGMPAEEAAKAAVQLPENDNLRAVEITYRYRIDDVENSSASHIRSGVVLPVRADGATIGSLSAFSRSAGQKLGEAQIDELERLAFRAGPALENARKYTEARALADLDALTGLHNRRYFHETLAREVARAQRYGRRLALIVFDLDDFKTINDRVGHLAGDAVLAEAAERLLSVVRSADVACRVGGDEFAVVLPESNVEEAELLAGRIARAINTRPITPAGTVTLSAGVAELRPSDRPTDIFERADEALYRAKELGKDQTHVAANGA
ncbi:MAG TPA: sensor domain-containing diguanylate cyclase [Gaiellaceae bacterium]|nr:sensor domain-containing diguanylate cyclase [Gaiellaceae bacterium]